ncbi:MAG: hypothetical protein HC810_05805, partial [Acaryochloridaceae cyanobacterium RL_2_7]|nr:hypothetical protein [Acaryochloridaceae cyanobacterium RL_2_7]
MRKGSDLIGKLIVSYDQGETIARVEDLIFDHANHSLLGLIVEEGSWWSGPWVIPVEKLMTIGADAIIVPTAQAIAPARKLKAIRQLLKEDRTLKGTRIMTTTGSHLGNLVDLYFDQDTKALAGYEVSGGLFADVYSGRSFVPAPKTISIGINYAFVPPEVADLMAEQVGGILGSVQLAGERLQEGSGLVSRRLHEIVGLVTQKLQETSSYTNEKVRAITYQAVTSVMNSIVNPDEQKLFILGRSVDHDIYLADGQLLIRDGQRVDDQILTRAEEHGDVGRLYVAVGGSVAQEISQRIKDATDASNEKLREIMNQAVSAMMDSIVDPIEQKAFILGKPLGNDIHLANGHLFVASGSIVTREIADKAEDLLLLSQLYRAVGGNISEELSRRVKEATTSSNERVQEVVHQAISQMMSNLIDPKERKAFILGKAVDQDILAADGHIIIHQGDVVSLEQLDSIQEPIQLDKLFHAVGGSYANDLSRRVQDVTDTTNNRLSTIVQHAVSAMTQKVVDPKAQKEFMLGKTVEYDVVSPDGTLLIAAGNPVTQKVMTLAEDQAMLDQLYRATGGSFVAELSQKAKQILARQWVSQTEGRRIRKEIRTEEDLIIAAMGQIVTAEVIGGEGRPQANGRRKGGCRFDLVAAEFGNNPVRGGGQGQFAGR